MIEQELNKPLRACKCGTVASTVEKLELFVKGTNTCKTCRKTYMEEYYQSNKAALAKAQKQYYIENKDSIIEYNKIYYEANKVTIRAKQNTYITKNSVKIAEYKKEWQMENSERIKEKDHLYYLDHKEAKQDAARKYARSNRGKVNALGAKRRARKLAQTPQLTEEEVLLVSEVYYLAEHLTRLTNEQYHVDHIIPLSKGGIHHPENLRAIPAVDNLIKSAALGFELTHDNIVIHAKFHNISVEMFRYWIGAY